MEIINYYAILGAIVSIVAAIISTFVLHRSNKRIKEYHKDIGDLISPQREYVENKVYASSNPLVQDPGFLEDANSMLFVQEPNNEMTIKTELPDFSFFENMGIHLPDVKVKEEMVMCLMPFNRRFDKTKTVIVDSCKKAGFSFHRSDDELIAYNTDLRKSIIRMIAESQVVVAVLDGRNPNVFYEIGIAHSLGKLVLMVVNLSREENKWREVDVLSNRLITYNNPHELEEKLVKTFKQIHSYGRRNEKTNN